MEDRIIKLATPWLRRVRRRLISLDAMSQGPDDFTTRVVRNAMGSTVKEIHFIRAAITEARAGNSSKALSYLRHAKRIESESKLDLKIVGECRFAYCGDKLPA